MNEDLHRLLLEELALRSIAQSKIPDVLEGSFDRQREFILDPSRKKALFCTRRSAKSFTAGLYLVHAALQHPGCNFGFIGLTRASAEAIIWKDILKVINSKYELGAAFNSVQLRMRFPNESEIIIVGVDADEDEKKKLLGRKFKLICIDEASMYSTSLQGLIELLEPSMVDQRGTICLMGTASNFPHGVFYDITTGQNKAWKLFTWSAYDNPYISEQWAEEIESIKRDRPLYMETPQFKQWYLNQWIVDEEKLCYKFNPEKNLTKTIPKLGQDGWVYVLGVDTGWEDASAFVLTAYHLNDPHLYVLSTYHRSKMTFDDMVVKIQEFMNDPYFAPHKVIIDGANKQGVESMKARSAIPFEYADKRDKVTFMELANSDLIEGKIKILDSASNKPLWDEMLSLVWVTDGDKIKYPKKENPTLSNHLCDAFLYAWRCGFHYSSQPAVKVPKLFSPEWYTQQHEKVWEIERQNLEKERVDDGNWLDMGSFEKDLW